MRTFYSKVPFLFILVTLASSCQETNNKQNTGDHITDTKAKEVILKSIERHGGLAKWQAKKKLNYTKDFALFTSDGSQESFTKQKHDYNFKIDEFLIRTETKDKTILLKKFEDLFVKTVNGEESTDPQEKHQKSFNTSMYVVSMPFKLLDPGVDLKYEGTEKIDSGKETHVIKAVYDTGKNKNHSTDDTWWYYFDIEDYTLVANKVITHDHSAIVDNLSFIESGGILFNGHRKSYRLDSLGKKDYLRAEYFYENYQLD